MAQFNALVITLRSTFDEWLRTRWSDLQFADARTALLVFVVLLAASVLVFLVRWLLGRRAGRTHLALPAILPLMRHSPLAALRHAPLVLFLLGLPLFAVALAQPLTGFTREEVSYPGRRIALLVDASTSMVMQFKSDMKRQGRRPTSRRLPPRSGSWNGARAARTTTWWR